MSRRVKGDGLCGKVAAGVGGDAGRLGSFQGRNLQDAPASLKRLSLLRQGLWSKEEGLGFWSEDLGGTDLPESS